MTLLLVHSFLDALFLNSPTFRRNQPNKNIGSMATNKNNLVENRSLGAERAIQRGKVEFEIEELLTFCLRHHPHCHTAHFTFWSA